MTYIYIAIVKVRNRRILSRVCYAKTQAKLFYNINSLRILLYHPSKREQYNVGASSATLVPHYNNIG